MNQGSRSPSLFSGVLLLTIGVGWLLLMVSNRNLLLPLFFLGGKTLAYPVSLWLLGAFLLGNGLSFALLRLLESIATLEAVPARSAPQRSFFSPKNSRFADRDLGEEDWGESAKPASSQSDRPLSWDDEPEDWQEDPLPKVATRPSPPPTADQPPLEQKPIEKKPLVAPPPMPEDDEEDAWDDPQWEAESIASEPPADLPQPSSVERPERSESPVSDSTPSGQVPVGKSYEAPSAPPQGSQSGSTYSYRYRPASRSTPERSTPPQESVYGTDRPPSAAKRPPRPQVFDVNYRVIDPGQAPKPKPDPRNDRSADRGWEKPNEDDWD